MSSPSLSPPSIEVRDMHFSYGHASALRSLSFDIPDRQVTAFIGPSGCGKSTLLRCFNRMNDEIPGARLTRGSIRVGGIDIQDRSVDVVKLRQEVGMVFQKSNPFPRSIFDNVAFGLRLHRMSNRALLSQPRLLILDEPSMGLAPKMVENIFQVIKGLRERGDLLQPVRQRERVRGLRSDGQ